MEGLRDSKLEEGQQWGKNTSLKDKVQRGRRPPFIEGEKSNRYVLSPHTSGTTAPRAVLPLWRKKQGKGATKHEPWGGSTAYKRYYRAPQRYYRWRSRTRDQKRQGRVEYDSSNAVAILPPDRSGTTAYRRYYRPFWAALLLIGGTAVPYCRATTAKLDTKNARPKIEAVPARNRSRTTAYGHRRYYRFGQRYYRLG